MENQKTGDEKSMENNNETGTESNEEKVHDTNEDILTNNAIAVLNKRYFQKDPEGNVSENWKGLCNRVAKCLAEAGSETGDTETSRTFRA